MIGCSEAKVPLYAIAPCGKTEWSFGGDMDGIGCERIQPPLKPWPRAKRKPYVRLGRARRRAKQIGRQRDHLVSGDR